MAILALLLPAGQQAKEGDSAPLLHSGESPPGVLCPALEPSAQERHGLVGAGPEEGHEDDQKDGVPSEGWMYSTERKSSRSPSVRSWAEKGRDRHG